jgi:hypothetical protein
MGLTLSVSRAPDSTVALPAPQVGIGIKLGDTVTVGTGFGWVNAIVLGAEGHTFRVRLVNGDAQIRRYPAELRRLGKLTAYDRANGIYEVNDRVKVHFEGAWIDSHIVSGLGMEYQVELPGDRMAWAKPEQLRFVSEAPAPAVAKAGQPPKPGLKSCTGKIEGRYAATDGQPFSMTFRSGKVTMTMMGSTESGECWIGDGKLFVTMPGEENAMEIEINDDGTLLTPLGELTKKAK